MHVPYPPVGPDWTRTTLSRGVALQCAPSKDRIARYALHELSPRQLGALSLVEGGVAAGWIGDRFPGLVPELRRMLPDLEIADHDLEGDEILDRAMDLTRERHGIFVFTGNTRHRVEVDCLNDFHDTHFVDPSSPGLRTGGYTRVDPLPEVFGPRRSRRIRRAEELPRVLAHIHRELVTR